ncbi:MAG TPA: hypothetical protein VM432_08495 [Bdellovibrionales bacterium]|nr:hypothetical protein [Bdellovibrionales bacterium]
MKSFFFALLLLSSTFAHAQALSELPNLEALVLWHDMDDYESSSVLPEQLPAKISNCADQKLYPTHPQQNLKRYHVYQWGQYDHHRLNGDDEACAVPAKFSSKNPKPCLRAYPAHHIVMSDTFTNACGEKFRGFMEIYFLEAYENMGTMFSWGRTAYQNPKSEFPGDFFEGGTYPIEQERFLKLTPLLDGDDAAIQESLRQLPKHLNFNPATHLFTEL